MEGPSRHVLKSVLVELSCFTLRDGAASDGDGNRRATRDSDCPRPREHGVERIALEREVHDDVLMARGWDLLPACQFPNFPVDVVTQF